MPGVPIRLTQGRRLMGRALWAATHTRLGRCPKTPFLYQGALIMTHGDRAGEPPEGVGKP